MYHVTSDLNRESIRARGLDWSHMGRARGIAGSSRPEEQGVFLCVDEHEAEYFVELNNTGGPVDVWAVGGIDPGELVESGNGYRYLPRRIPPERLTLVRASVESGGPEPGENDGAATGAYRSSLTISLHDGTVLREGEADEFVRRSRGDGQAGAVAN